MDNVYEFLRDALPWVAMGLLLIIFFVRSAVKKKKGTRRIITTEWSGCVWECALVRHSAQHSEITPVLLPSISHHSHW